MAEIMDVKIPAVGKIPPVIDLCDSDGEDENENNNNNFLEFPDIAEVPAVARAPTRIPDFPLNDTQVPQNRKRQRDVYEGGNAFMGGNGQGQQQRANVALPIETLSPIEKILDVFPDVDREYATTLLEYHNQNIGLVVSTLADEKYPTSKEAAAPQTDALSVKRVTVVSEPRHDYLSTDSFEPHGEYYKQAFFQLQHDFPFMSKRGIDRILIKASGHYAIAREIIFKTIMGKDAWSNKSGQPKEEHEESRYQIMKQALTCSLDQSQLERFGPRNTLKRRRKGGPPEITDPTLQDELKHVQHKCSTWMEAIELRLNRRKARKISQLDGTAVECSCCFEKVHLDEMVACRDEGHLFCVDCLKSYAETQIFASGNLGLDKETRKPALELKCCHGDGCNSGFHESHLQKALPFKTLERYNQLQFQASIDQAGLGQDLCACPKCGFQADVPTSQRIFQCPVEDCRFESCRLCGEKSHIPLRCEEVLKEQRREDGRLKVEEAITAAKIRKCPKCKQAFIKSDGCNKMTCSCGAFVCYICRKQIDREKYNHFCQQPHCDHSSCNKCQLYSNAEEDDARAMREAGIVAAETYQDELRQHDAGRIQGDVANVQIDVERILRDPFQPQRA